MVNVHIAIVGKTTENVVNGVTLLGGSELYPITSEKFKGPVVKAIRDGLPAVQVHNQINGKRLIIDPFTDEAFFQIVGLMVDISTVHKNKGDALWVNVTGGTNLMSAAAATGAIMTESSAYYVREAKTGKQSSIIELPPMYKSAKILENKKRRRLTQALYEHGCMTNDELGRMVEENKKSVSKQLKILEGHSIVHRRREGRKVFNKLTDNGKIAVSLVS